VRSTPRCRADAYSQLIFAPEPEREKPPPQRVVLLSSEVARWDCAALYSCELVPRQAPDIYEVGAFVALDPK